MTPMRKLLKRVDDIGAEEYAQKREELFSMGSTTRNIYVPDSKNFRKEVLKIFSKSNHWLCKPVFIYRNQGRELSYYIFSRMKLVTERNGEGYVTMVFTKSADNQFKQVVLRRLFCLDDLVAKQYKRHVTDMASLYDLSDAFKQWAETENERSFGVWMRFNGPFGGDHGD